MEIEVRGLTKKYSSIIAIKSVSFIMRPGEVVGLLGPNGAGKTTTIKILAGLSEPTEGEILFKGKRISNNMREYKSRIGYLPEHSEIYPHLTAFEYLQLVGALRNIEKKVLNEKIQGFMKLFGLENEMHFSIGSYSKGMKQKVLIVSALLHDPDILLLDEPFSGLDTNTVIVFRTLIKKLAEEGKIILYSSHLLEEVEKICSRVIIIHNGSILADDLIQNLEKLMNVDSLENVFKQLVISEDSDETAKKILDLVKHK